MIPLTEIFVCIHDFCKDFQAEQAHTILPCPNRKRRKACRMHISEVMTILVMFQLSHYRTFKDFYFHCLLPHYKREFPQLVSYTRFVELIPFAWMPLTVLLLALSGKQTGKYFTDTTKLPVCEMSRMHSHKVCKGVAKIGKTSIGWFFGLKLHLVLNEQGELMRFCLTPGNQDDRSMVARMMKGLEGWLFADKGYISQKRCQVLKQQGISLYTKLRRNMKKRVLQPLQAYLLSKRGIIESAIDQLKSVLHIQHTRHRSVLNLQVNILAGLLAYVFKPKKPHISFHSLNQIQNLMSN